MTMGSVSADQTGSEVVPQFARPHQRRPRRRRHRKGAGVQTALVSQRSSQVSTQPVTRSQWKSMLTSAEKASWTQISIQKEILRILRYEHQGGFFFKGKVGTLRNLIHKKIGERLGLSKEAMEAVRLHPSGSLVPHFHQDIERARQDLVDRDLVCGIPNESWELTPKSLSMDIDSYHTKNYPKSPAMDIQSPAMDIQSPAMDIQSPVQVGQTLSPMDLDVYFTETIIVQAQRHFD